MIERVQVKVFFCFPASEVPTFVGSPDGRESRLAPEVPTAGSPGVRREFRRRSDCADLLPTSFITGPVLFYCGFFSSTDADAALAPPRAAPSRPPLPPPPHLVLRPPSFFLRRRRSCR